MTQMDISMKQTDTESRSVVPRGRGGGEKDSEFGISRCKLLYIEWVKNRILLYSTGTVFNIL